MTARPFTFDTVFDGDGEVLVAAPLRPRRTYTADEVEALRGQAFRDGEAAALAAAETQRANALAEIALAMKVGLSALAQAAHDHRTGSAELALTAARRIADAALDRFPHAPVTAALETLAREIETAPRLVVRTGSSDPALGEELEEAARAAGFAGQIVVRPEPGPTHAAFVLEWGDGKAAFDPAASTERIAAALHDALAGEGLHAEPLDLSPYGAT